MDIKIERFVDSLICDGYDLTDISSSFKTVIQDYIMDDDNYHNETNITNITNLPKYVFMRGHKKRKMLLSQNQF